jgi:hypothetical protein
MNSNYKRIGIWEILHTLHQKKIKLRKHNHFMQIQLHVTT